MTPFEFIITHTEIRQPPLVPEIRLLLADDMLHIWEDGKHTVEPPLPDMPMWAICWAGGQGLARYILDNPQTVKGKRVLSVGCGGGVEAIAAAKAGAAEVIANDIDPFALEAANLNAAMNNVSLTLETSQLAGKTCGDWQVILAGDIFYRTQSSKALTEWFCRLTSAGRDVLIGEAGRDDAPLDSLEEIASFDHGKPIDHPESKFTATRVWRFRSA